MTLVLWCCLIGFNGRLAVFRKEWQIGEITFLLPHKKTAEQAAFWYCEIKNGGEGGISLQQLVAVATLRASPFHGSC